MTKTGLLASAAVVGLLAAVAAAPGAARAQASDKAQAVLAGQGQTAADEVVVTAQKRVERALDVPMSVTAVQAEPLVSTGQVLLRDYYTQIPGFSVAPSFNATQELSIRGISTGGGNPTVGVLVDDAPYPQVNDIPDIDPEDLARIEVLKGPQGTLYGANSMGGLINYITADPSTSKIFGRIEAGASTTDNGAEPGYSLRGSVNLPISDTIAIRLSAFTRQDPGYIDNVRFNLRGVNQTEASGARLAVLWQPVSQLTVRLSATYQDTQAPGGTLINPSLGQDKIDLLPGADASTFRPQIYNARLVYDFGPVSLTSITSYSRNSYSELTDFSTIWGPAASAALKQNVGVIQTCIQGFSVFPMDGRRVLLRPIFAERLDHGWS
jgi:outer membrane receptor protein involved in Fe transport